MNLAEVLPCRYRLFLPHQREFHPRPSAPRVRTWGGGIVGCFIGSPDCFVRFVDGTLCLGVMSDCTSPPEEQWDFFQGYAQMTPQLHGRILASLAWIVRVPGRAENISQTIAQAFHRRTTHV